MKADQVYLAHVRDAIERIARLLYLISPDRYPACVGGSLGSDDPVTTAAALEYLDTTLPSPYRQMLISLLERWPPTPIASPLSPSIPLCSAAACSIEGS